MALTNEQLASAVAPNPLRARSWQAPEARDTLMIFIVVKFTIRADRSDEWLALADKFTQATRNETGNLFFEWSRNVDNPHQFFLVEAFASGHAGEVHVNSEHFKTAMTWMPEVIAETPQIVSVEVGQEGWGRIGELAPRGDQ